MLKFKHNEKLVRLGAAVRVTATVLLLLILLNKLFFHIEWFDSFKSAAAVGNGIKPYVSLADGEAAVYFLNTGQSDCSLIIADNYTVLIDGGDLDKGNILVGALESLGIKRLDYVIVTHPHVDHFGGLTEILSGFPIGVLLTSEIPGDMIPRTLNYSRLLAVMERYGVQSKFVRTGDNFSLGNNSRLEIAAPLYNDYAELNNLSVAVRFVHGENSFLFTGDLENVAERDLLGADICLDADVLKVGHHGSEGSSGTDFLAAITPKIAVFEVGFDNTFGHPKTEVIERLSDIGCREIYATSLNGNIAVISDGGSLRVEVEKNNAVILNNYG